MCTDMHSHCIDIDSKQKKETNCIAVRACVRGVVTQKKQDANLLQIHSKQSRGEHVFIQRPWHCANTSRLQEQLASQPTAHEPASWRARGSLAARPRWET
jgi:hypothetical protein